MSIGNRTGEPFSCRNRSSCARFKGDTLKPTLLAAAAVILAASLTGCAAFPSMKSGCYDGVADAKRGEPLPGDFEDRYANRCNTVGCHGKHCGLCGITGGLAHESCALMNCLFSTRWEGDYPHGGLGPWVGCWNRECCCSSADDYCEEVYTEGTVINAHAAH
jgi:hypothetical protein